MRGILEKYEIALVLLRKPGFDVARSPYQEVSILAQLRNAIVHYQPVWVMGSSPNQAEKIAEHRFEKSLRGRFPLNPLTSDNKPFFPDKCLGHGCAAWAVASAISFADEFFAKTGLTPPYEHVRTHWVLDNPWLTR
jgi:hypothetical protein